jgi:hypothetical protein
MTEPPVAGRRWFQFQLRTILVFIAFVGLLVAQVATIQRARRLEGQNRDLSAENSKLRVEAGYLEIEDPSKVAVLRIQNFDELTWQWKIWLPKGDWSVNFDIHDIAPQGVRNGSYTGWVSGDREIVGYTTLRKDVDGVWKLRNRLDQQQIGCDLEPSHGLVKQHDGGGRRTGYTATIAGDKSQESFDQQEPVVLLRLRAHEIVTTPNGTVESRDTFKSSDGIMVWLRRQK